MVVMTNPNQTMKAVSYSSYGGPDVLEVVDVPVPEPTGIRCASLSAPPG